MTRDAEMSDPATTSRWCSAASRGETDSSVVRTLLRQAETAVVLYSTPTAATPPASPSPTACCG